MNSTEFHVFYYTKPHAERITASDYTPSVECFNDRETAETAAKDLANWAHNVSFQVYDTEETVYVEIENINNR